MTLESKWWFQPEYTQVHLFREPEAPWNRDNGGDLCPESFRERYPGSFLCVHPETKKGIQRVTLVNPGCGEQDYWVCPLILQPLRVDL